MNDAPGSWSGIVTGRLGVITFVLALGIMLFAVNQFIVATIMPTVVADLGGLDYYSWTFSLFAVGAIMGAASGGALRDAFGARRSYAGAGLVLGLGLVGAALATDMPTLVAFRLVQGIGGGAIASQAYGLVAILYPQNLRGRVLTVISTVWGVATVGGPGFGAFFAEPGLWRFAFWSLTPFTIIFACLVWRYVGGGSGHGRLSEMPYWRLALLGLAVLLMSATSLDVATWARFALVAAAVALAAYAMMRDARAERAMFPRQAALIMTEIGATYWIVFLVSVVLTFVNTYTTFYLQVLHGVSPFSAGYLYAIQSFMWTGAALIVAAVRAGREVTTIFVGLTLILISAVAIAIMVEPGPVLGLAIAIGICGAGIGCMNNPAIQRVIAVAPEEEKHIAGTSVQTVRNIGVSFGAAATGMVASLAGLTDGASRETVATAMQWVYGVNIVFAALALVVVTILILNRRRGR